MRGRRRTEVAAWTRTVFDYLRGRPRLRRVYVLVDARHGLKPNDEEALDTLDKAAVSYQIVLTKADKAKGGDLAGVIAATAAKIAKRPAAHPEVLATSSATGDGDRPAEGGDRRPDPALPAADTHPRFVPLSQTRYRPALTRRIDHT